jgi:hypothetical protein
MKIHITDTIFFFLIADTQKAKAMLFEIFIGPPKPRGEIQMFLEIS